MSRLAWMLAALSLLENILMAVMVLCVGVLLVIAAIWKLAEWWGVPTLPLY